MAGEPRLHRREERFVARARHADESHAFGVTQPAPRDLVAKLRRPGMVGRHQHVGAQYLVRFARERLPHAVGEEGDTGHPAYGEHESEREHAQLPRAPVAQEHAKGETLHRFQPSPSIRPATSRIRRRQRPAIASSCVTSTSVVRASAFISNMSLITPAPVAASRFPAPELGVSSPASSPRSVDLPDPEAPTTATASPGMTLSEMSCRITSSLAPGVPFAVLSFSWTTFESPVAKTMGREKSGMR